MIPTSSRNYALKATKALSLKEVAYQKIDEQTEALVSMIGDNQVDYRFFLGFKLMVTEEQLNLKNIKKSAWLTFTEFLHEVNHTLMNDFVSMPNDEINRYMKMEKLLENKISRRFKVRRLEINDFGYLMEHLYGRDGIAYEDYEYQLPKKKLNKETLIKYYDLIRPTRCVIEESQRYLRLEHEDKESYVSYFTVNAIVGELDFPSSEIFYFQQQQFTFPVDTSMNVEIVEDKEDGATLAKEILTFLTGISTRDGDKFPVLISAISNVSKSEHRGLLNVITELRKENTPIANHIANHIASFTNYDFAHLLFSDGTVKNTISLDNQLNIIQVADLVLPDKDTTFNEYTTIELLSVSMLIVISTFVDDTINAENLYSKYPLSNYQLDFYVDNSWSWLPWNWLDGIGKSVQYGLYCITNFVWTISLYLSNATGYVVQEAYKLDFINDMADSIGQSIQTLAGVTQNGFSSTGFYVGFLLLIILVVGLYVAYTGLIKRETSKAVQAVINFLVVFVLSASFIAYAPDYIKKINEFSSDISTASLDLGTKIMLPNSDSEGKK